TSVNLFAVQNVLSVSDHRIFRSDKNSYPRQTSYMPNDRLLIRDKFNLKKGDWDYKADVLIGSDLNNLSNKNENFFYNIKEATIAFNERPNIFKMGFQRVSWVENFSKSLNDPFTPLDLRNYITVTPDESMISHLAIAYNYFSDSGSDSDSDSWWIESFFAPYSATHIFPSSQSSFFIGHSSFSPLVDPSVLDEEDNKYSLKERYSMGVRINKKISQFEGNLFVGRVLNPFYVIREVSLLELVRANNGSFREHKHFDVVGSFGSLAIQNIIFRYDLLFSINKKVNYIDGDVSSWPNYGPGYGQVYVQQIKKNFYDFSIGLDYNTSQNDTLSLVYTINEMINKDDKNYLAEKSNSLLAASFLFPNIFNVFNLSAGISHYLKTAGNYTFVKLSKYFIDTIILEIQFDIFSGHNNDNFAYARKMDQMQLKLTYVF
ncbi:MAG: hypothetical protein HQK51_20460, partial [Oligoflexia bacterium]|nr:hypothetical protein [Oligoflexia bacterium]